MRHRLTKIARFASVRRIYSSFEHYRQALSRSSMQLANEETSILITDSGVGDFVSRLRLKGIATGVRLQQTMIDALRQYAAVRPCFVPPNADRRQSLDAWVTGTPPASRAHVCEPLHCAAVQRVVADAYLIDVARQYLGYLPNRIEPSLIWSIAGGSPAEQAGYDAAKYHYDTQGFNSLQAVFYLTDVSRYSGAHAVIPESHRRKSLEMKLQSSTRIGERKLHDYYGEQAEMVVVGTSGTGFVEDPACFHRILHPTSSNRLALRLIYS